MTRPFKFCPADGTKLGDPGNDSGAKCPKCGRAWYHNSAPTAGIVLVDGERALITQRGRPPEEGRFDIPGGFLEHDEDPVEGVKREAKEELGLDIEVELSDLVQMVPHPYGDDGDWVLAIGFIGRFPGGDVKTGDDVVDYRWVGLDDLADIDFAWDHDRALVKKALSN